MNFFERLEQRAKQAQSLLCVGLDPHPADLRRPTAGAARDFCVRLVDATYDIAAAYKPNAAFFEAFGQEGWAALVQVIQMIPRAVPVILDAKRGDIASTAEAYARSAFELLDADAITLNPYLGQDSIAPFVKDPAKGVFLLCKTSNPGAADLQDLPLWLAEPGPWQSFSPRPLYEQVALLAERWNEQGNIGLVVGATQLDALARVRAAVPGLWFLAPGVGAQGADLDSALQAGLRADGLGMLIPVSRGISQAEAPRQAALALRDQINQARQETQKARRTQPAETAPALPFASLADALLEIGCVKFGEFTLKSGQVSPIYIDLRRLAAFPKVLTLAAQAYLTLLRPLQFNHLAALPYAALPIGTAIGLLGNWPLIYPRKETKEYGTKTAVEGVFNAGDTAVVIDDLVTTGESKFEGIEKLSAAGLQVKDIVVLINRQAEGTNPFEEKGLRLHSVFSLPQLLEHWEKAGKVPSEQVRAAHRFLQGQGNGNQAPG